MPTYDTVKTSQNKHQIRLLFQRICEILCSLKVPQNYGDESIQKAVGVLVRYVADPYQSIYSHRLPIWRNKALGQCAQICGLRTEEVLSEGDAYCGRPQAQARGA